MDIRQLGWEKYSQSQKKLNIEQDYVARVAVENRGGYLLYSNFGELEGMVQGKFIKKTQSESDYPKVGDWVKISKLPNEQKAVIEEILPRESKLSRRRVSKDRSEIHKKNEEQIIAANVDMVFVLQGLDEDFSLERLERYLQAIEKGGAKSIVLLNKCDLANDSKEKLEAVLNLGRNIEAYLISAKHHVGLDTVREIIAQHETIVFVGSSGVGKSTLINALLGIDLQKTQEIRLDDSKGRHTTTRREMFLLPGGGILIDTPGMRELMPWSEETEFQLSKAKNAAKQIAKYSKKRKF